MGKYLGNRTKLSKDPVDIRFGRLGSRRFVLPAEIGLFFLEVADWGGKRGNGNILSENKEWLDFSEVSLFHRRQIVISQRRTHN